MVRSTITPNTMSGGFAAAQTADVIDKTNDHVVTPTKRHMILALHISAATAADTVKIIAGDNPPAFRSGIGDLTYACVGGAAEVVMGPIETARFLQNDGTINIDVAGSSIAGTIDAYEFD